MTKPVLLYFIAPRCAPCKALAPALLYTAAALGLDIRAVDCTLSQQTARKYHVQATPTLLLLKDGHPYPVQEVGTVPSEAELRRKVAELLEGG